MKPKTLKEFIGQEKIKEDLESLITYSNRNKTCIGHCVLLGGAGHGKTTLSEIIAKETGTRIVKIFGGSISEAVMQDILDLLSFTEEPITLFIDEVHATKAKYLEYLYTPMERFEYNGEDIKKFTLIAATTDFGLLPKPFRDRFSNTFKFGNYTLEEIMLMLENQGCKENVARHIAERSRFTPRVAVDILFKRILIEWDNVSDKTPGTPLNIALCDKVFDLLSIDKHGLNDKDREVISYLYSVKAFETSTRIAPCGLDALTTALNVSRSDYTALIEPFLLQQGFIIRGPRGRYITKKAMTVVLNVSAKVKTVKQERDDQWALIEKLKES